MRRLTKGKESFILCVPTVLAAVFTLFVLVPLIVMFTHLDVQSIQKVFSRDSLPIIIWRSIFSSVLTTIISITLAGIFAWCMERTAMRGKRIFRILVVLPMLIPSVSIGMGTVILCGNSGILTNILGLHTGSVYGLGGIVWGSVMYSLPVAFLMIDNILKYEDCAPYEAANILGIPSRNQFFSITIPYLRKPMIAVTFSVFTLSFTDYGVPLMVGGKYKTLPVVMYQEVIGQLDFGKGCVYGSMLLVPAIIAFLVDFTNNRNANISYVTKQYDMFYKPGRDIIATVFSIFLSIFSVLPIISFIVLTFVKKYPVDMTITFSNILKTIQLDGGKYLLNSVLIALFVSIFGAVMVALSAYFTARTHARFTHYLHLICMSTAAIPGIVLGLAYVLFFKGTIVYDTLIILIAVNMVHFFASPYLMMYTSFLQINENLESVASTFGIGKMRLLIDVFIPRCKHTIKEIFSYFFVNCMMTISAVSFLANSNTKPISLMINQFEAQMQLECASVVSLAILIVNLIVKVIMEKQS